MTRVSSTIFACGMEECENEDMESWESHGENKILNEIKNIGTETREYSYSIYSKQCTSEK